MESKDYILKLKTGESISILNSKNSGVFIENENDILKIKETDNSSETLYIKSLTKSELVSYALTILLENNSQEIKSNKQNKEIISKLLENQFNKICGDNKNDIIDMEFQVITHYKKE